MKAPKLKLTKTQRAASGFVAGAAAAMTGVYLLLGLAWVLLIGGLLIAALCLLGVDVGGRR